MPHSPILCFLLAICALSIPGCVSNPLPAPTQPAALSSAPDISPTAIQTLDTITGSLRNQINALEDKMPRANSADYVIPTDQERADFAELIPVLGSGNLARAVHLAAENNYTLNYYEDRGDDKAVNYLLRERTPIQKGWGLYVFRVNSTSNIIVEAPHPLYDRHSPSVALDIYRALDARALLIAGAHRNANSDGSADVAHAAKSIFQSVHLALIQEIQAASADAIILQIHGFHTSKHEGYPQVVFGFGETVEPEELDLAENIKNALSKEGVRAGLCGGNALQDLCATTNVQGSAAYDGIFIHMELDEKLRRNDDALIAALIQVFGK